MADNSQAARNMRYRQQIEAARQRYNNGQDDWDTYIAKSAFITLQAATDAYMMEEPQYGGKARTALTVGQHAIYGAFKTVAHRFNDPSDAESHESVMHEIIRHAGDKFNEDLQPIRNFLAHLGIRI